MRIILKYNSMKYQTDSVGVAKRILRVVVANTAMRTTVLKYRILLACVSIILKVRY